MKQKLFLFICVICLSSKITLIAQYIPDSMYQTNNNIKTEEKLDSVALIIQNLRNSDPKQGIEIGFKTLASINYSKSTKNLARVFDEMGISFRKLGEYNFAAKYHFEALKIFKDITDSMGQAFTLHNIGNVYRLLKQYDISLDYLFESVKIKREFNDLYQISFSLNTIGLVYEEKGIIDTAEIYMKQALQIALGQDNKMNLANIYSNLGSVELKSGKYYEAEKYLKEALEIYSSGIANYGIAQALGRLSKVYLKTNNNDKAISNLNLGLKKVKSIQAKDLEKDFYHHFFEYYKKIGNYKKSTEYLEKYIDIVNILSNENKIKQMTQSEFIYHLGEKIKENDLLKKTNEIYELKYSNQKIILFSSLTILAIILIFLILLFLRNRKIRIINSELLKKEQILNKLNSDLEDLNNTQKKFFSIISHDLRNPFNFLILSSSMMLEKYGDLEEKEKIELLNGIETVSKESYTLLSNLLDWSKLQTGRLKANKTSYLLYESSEKNIVLLSNLAIQKHVKIVDNIKKNIYVNADKDMVDTIIRNLITNAIKYSEKNDVITVNAYKKQDEIVVCVEDEGVGMDKEVLKGLFNAGVNESRVGTKNETGTGLGLLLCKELVEENTGKIWVESKLNSGTKIFFSLSEN